MAAAKPLEKIAIIGATGHIGRYITEALAKTGKHTITALRRAESKGTLPAGVVQVDFDYADPSSLVTALKGQQLLIVTLSVRAPPTLQSQIFKAAVEAGVPWVMPNAYGADVRGPKSTIPLSGPAAVAEAARETTVKEIEALGLKFVTLACGVWYEWSLALGEPWFGFSIKERKVTFIDDGLTKLPVSTWLQCGRAVAALLSLPESGAKPALEDWKNASVLVQSFSVSQRDMLDSMHRVLGTTDADWEITFEAATKRNADGLEEFGRGMFTGVAKILYASFFMRARAGEMEHHKRDAGEVLGLPEESLDEATKRAVEMVEAGWSPHA